MAPKPAPKPVTPVRDTLDPTEAAKQGGIPWSLVQSDAGLSKVFADAQANGWFDPGNQVGQQKFINAVAQTDWFKQNSSFARQYLFLKEQGGAAFDEQVSTAKKQVQAQAVKTGAQLDDAALSKLTEQYMMNGWGTQGRESYLPQALTGQLPGFTADYLNYSKGSAGKLVDQLKQVATLNGVQLSDGWFQSAARAVEGGLGTADDYLHEIRSTAASAYPVYADKIKSGFNVADLVSPYVNTMANVLELDPTQIRFDDPMIQKAVGAVDAKTGAPAATGMWAFQQQLRSDPRWQQTDNAYKAYAEAGQSVLQMFGFR